MKKVFLIKCRLVHFWTSFILIKIFSKVLFQKDKTRQDVGSFAVCTIWKGWIPGWNFILKHISVWVILAYESRFHIMVHVKWPSPNFKVDLDHENDDIRKNGFYQRILQPSEHPKRVGENKKKIWNSIRRSLNDTFLRIFGIYSIFKLKIQNNEGNTR